MVLAMGCVVTKTPTTRMWVRSQKARAVVDTETQADLPQNAFEKVKPE